jgi:triphosphoribosyl-dephospho-CoA synthase
MMHQAEIRAAFLAACADELAVPKPGNVHIHAGGHGMTVSDFMQSAEAAAPALCRRGAKLGERILGAVQSTRSAVGQNTNLGIILLAAPLVMAAERPENDLQTALRRVLDAADLGDTQAVFSAIRLAAPAGLAQAPRHDVTGPADVALVTAMAEAADRDSIARQWASGFADVFGAGMEAYLDALGCWPDPTWAPLGAYLWFLAAIPDSHILRKYGLATAEHIRQEAVPVRQHVLGAPDPAMCLPELLEWDSSLKACGINPGTSADLTVATILAHRLQRSTGGGPNNR